MALDHILLYQNYGVYMQPSAAPQIPHPVVPLMGNLFYVLSTSAAADGTRAEDFYLINLQGVKPVCSCRGFSYHHDCPHLAIVAAQMPALVAEVDTLFAADRAARKAARIAREAGRGQSATSPISVPAVPPPTKQAA